MLGLIGKKIGMTRIFDEAGKVTPVTVLQIEDNYVVALRNEEKNGYNACVLGSGLKKKSRVTKPYAGQFPEGVEPTQYLIECRDFDLEANIGDKLTVETFRDIDFVDVVGISKGKGFQGAMKRHGFGGVRKTHVSKFHRAWGGTGAATTPGTTKKGRKMAGRMGAERITVLNLRVMKVDADKGVLLVKGAVPGYANGLVFVREAIKG